MSKKVTHQNYVDSLETRNIEVLGTYISAKISIEHKCLVCGFIWKARPTNIKQGRGCHKCGGSDRKTSAQYIKELAAYTRYYKVLSAYVDCKTKILHKHLSCGHSWLITPSNIFKGRGCPKCFGTTKKTTKDYQEELGSDFIVLEKYINYKTKVTHKHLKCGYEWLVSPASILRNKGCPKCSLYGFDGSIPATLYYICIENNYYKVGITNKEINWRFRGDNIRIVWQHLFELGYEAQELESSIKQEFKSILNTEDIPNLFRKTKNTEVANFDFLGFD